MREIDQEIGDVQRQRSFIKILYKYTFDGRRK